MIFQFYSGIVKGIVKDNVKIICFNFNFNSSKIYSVEDRGHASSTKKLN